MPGRAWRPDGVRERPAPDALRQMTRSPAARHGRARRPGSHNPRMSPLRRLLPLPLLLAACAAVAGAPRVATLTSLDGEAVVLRDDARLAAAEGIALLAGDIVVTGAQTRLARIEYPNGLAIAFGPGSQALLEPHLDNEAVYLLAGWAKLNLPQGVAAAIGAPGLEVAASAGAAAVVALQADADRVFAESGTLEVRSRPAGAVAVTLANGQMATLAPGAKPEIATRPTAALVQAMPRAFMDTLPSRAAAFAGKDVAPKPLGPLAWSDAQPWVDAEPALRRGFVKRWRALAKVPEFRHGLVAGLKSHPEWDPVLNPPPPPRPASDPSRR